MTNSKPLTKISAAASATSDLTPAVSNPPVWLSTAMAVPREEGTLEVDGCPIHFFRWGEPDKPGIIMLHGFLSHARCFAFIAPYLAAEYQVVALDMSGMGDSGWHDEYTAEVRVSELLAVAEFTGLFDHDQKPTIVAHSFGGIIGTEAMYAHAEKFAGLIICDLMIIRPSVIAANAEKFKPPGNRTSDRPNHIHPDYQTARQRFVLSPQQPVEQPELLDFMAYHSLKEVKGGWQWKFDPKVFNKAKGAKTTRPEIGERVVNAPGRKTIIYGKDSVLFTADSVDYVKQLIDKNNADYIPIIDIPFARHHLMLDQPIAFVSALKTVLAMYKNTSSTESTTSQNRSRNLDG